MNSLDKVKKLMSRIDESYGLINETAESDKIENIRDINIEICRRFLIKAFERRGGVSRLTDNPRDYYAAPGGMKAGLDDDGHVFPQWPDCKVGDVAVRAMWSPIMVPIYSNKYRVPTEVNYNPGYGAQRLPNGKYELNGDGHDNWLKAYTPLLNGFMDNFGASQFPKIDGIPTYAGLGFAIFSLLSGKISLTPDSIFNFNKILKYMANNGAFSDRIDFIRNNIVRYGKNMTDNKEHIIGSTGPIAMRDNNKEDRPIYGPILIPSETDIDLSDIGKSYLSIDNNIIRRFNEAKDEYAENLRRLKEVSLEKYKDARLEPGKVKHTNSGYTILRIDSIEEAQQFRPYTTWCICTTRTSFDQYGMADGRRSGVPGKGRIYFCLRDDYKNVQKPEVQDGNPLDDYGLSMIAVTVWAEDGSCNTITSRWNHANGGNDDVMLPEELEEILGVSFYDAFPGEQ